MKKKGFLLLWSIVLISMVGVAVAINISSRDGTINIYNKLKYNELAYHHTLTIEEWGKRYIKSYEKNINEWWQTDHRLEKSFKNNMAGLRIGGKVGVDDGKINLYNLVVGSKSDKAIYADILTRLYGNEANIKVRQIIGMMAEGKPVIESGVLGKHDNMFTARVLDEDLLQDPNDVNESIYRIDLNALNPEVAKLLFGLDKEEVINIKSQGPFKNIESAMRAIEIPSKYKTLFKFKSLFYYIEGSIIQNEEKTNFKIDITLDKGFVKTSARQIY
jgi:hypothetical protein